MIDIDICVGIQAWLADFACRITVGPGQFLLAGLAALLLTLLSVGNHALRAAAANPADTLRYE